MRLRLPSPNRSAHVSPVRVNMPAVFLVGTAAWLLGGGVVGLWLAFGTGARSGWLAVCGAGAAIGLLGWGWSRWRHW